MDDIRMRVDADGVLADFRRAVMALTGLDPEDDRSDKSVIWKAIKAKPRFWETLGEMPDAQMLWAFLGPYNPSILTGVGGDPLDCRLGKRAWGKTHFGCDKVVVARSSRKSDFCRPGDILVDNSAKNIGAWEAVGGIGVLFDDAAATIGRMRTLGFRGDGTFSAELEAEITRRRNAREFRRDGYTGYVISSASQARLVDAFGVREGCAVHRPYRLVAQHITRAFPARMDTVDDAQPVIEVVGEFVDTTSGHHVLAVTVDGEITRPDGGFFHVTYALDDSSEAECVRKAAGGRRPTAGDSNKLLARTVDVNNGSVLSLFNLPLERRVSIDATFELLDKMKLASLPKARPPVTESVTVEPHEFAIGIVAANGDNLREGTKTTRTRGNEQTVTYDIFDADGTSLKHAEDGIPAIEKRDIRTGKILFRSWARAGKKTDGPWTNHLESAYNAPNGP